MMVRSTIGILSACTLGLAWGSNDSYAEGPTDWQPSIDAEAWDFWFSPGMPEHPTPAAGGGWEFAFPRYEGSLPCRDHLAPDCPSVHYLTTRVGGPLVGQSIKLTVEISGAPEFHFKLEPANHCEAPASVRLLIQRRDDDFTSEFHRWWSSPQSITLADGQYSVTVPLTPDQWSSVFGKGGMEAPEEFAQTLRDSERIGMTLGGGCFFGHGVNVSGGEATFTLKELTISR